MCNIVIVIDLATNVTPNYFTKTILKFTTDLFYISFAAILVLVVGCFTVVHHDILGIQLQPL